MIDEFKLARLARERARNIHSLPDLLNIYELTAEQYAEIEALPYYQRLLEAMNIEWNSSQSTLLRAKLISAAYVEDLLPVVVNRCKNENEPLPAVINGTKLLADIAGMGEKAADTNTPTERFIININLGEDTKLKFNKSRAIDVDDIDPNQIGIAHD